MAQFQTSLNNAVDLKQISGLNQNSVITSGASCYTMSTANSLGKRDHYNEMPTIINKRQKVDYAASDASDV